MEFHKQLRLSNPLAKAFFCLLAITCSVSSSSPVLGSDESASWPDTGKSTIHSATFLDSIPPIYPAIARKAEMEGTVVVLATINALGELVDSKIQKGVNPMLNRAALVALRSSIFSPARSGGKPCSSEFQVSYQFDLDLVYGRSARRERPPIDWTPPLISEVGELLETRGSGQLQFGVYSYKGLKIYGDLSVALLESAMEQVEPRLAAGEEVISIRHPLVYKDFGESGYLAQSDLEITTCTERRADGTCGRGNSYPFINQGGVYTLDLPEGLVWMWIH